MEECCKLKDITKLSRGNLEDLLLKMTPSKSFNIKIFMKLTFLVLGSIVLVYFNAMFHSWSVTDIKYYGFGVAKIVNVVNDSLAL